MIAKIAISIFFSRDSLKKKPKAITAITAVKYLAPKIIRSFIQIIHVSI
ncbi:MAG: hypothetical protein ACD_8C00016G0002 [uncultured bacterium]|nr:MAG: hypothetical protein ACD_8C00016G0002 [uncultured bacterium]